MQLGMIGLGRMGANMVRRLQKNGHKCVVYDRSADSVKLLEGEGVTGAASLDDFVKKLQKPRAVWLMVPAAVVDASLHDLVGKLEKDDVVIDGGNSYYIDDIRRAKELSAKGIHYCDVGTSGGVWGLERGYCQMIGGETDVVRRLDPIFKTLAPGRGNVDRTPGKEKVSGTAEEGYLHCGPAGAGHFVKMVHNGIEYGLMAAYAEGFNILHHANVGKQGRVVDAETTPLRQPEHYQYDFNVTDIAEVVSSAEAAVRTKGSFTIVLSGGSTPKSLYALLADDASWRARVPWEKAHFFWGDERHVPPDHPDSNYRMSHEAMLSKVPIPAANIHRI